MAAALPRDEAQRRFHELGGDRLVLAVMGGDDELERPVVVVGVRPADLGVADGMGMAGIGGHDPGEAGPAPVEEVEPLVLAEGGMAVVVGGGVEEDLHGADLVPVQSALHLDLEHDS